MTPGPEGFSGRALRRPRIDATRSAAGRSAHGGVWAKVSERHGRYEIADFPYPRPVPPSTSPRVLARALGLAALAIAPILAQHVLLRSLVGEEQRLRGEGAARAGSDLLQERVNRALDRWRGTALDLASSEAVIRAGQVDPAARGEAASEARRRAGAALADAVSFLEPDVSARLVHADGRVIASSSGREEPDGRAGELDARLRDAQPGEVRVGSRPPGPEAVFDLAAGVRPTAPGDRGTLWLRVPARHLDAIAREVVGALGQKARIVGVDAGGVCAIDTDGAALGRGIEPATPRELGDWERAKAFGPETAAVLRELAATPRLTGFLAPGHGALLADARAGGPQGRLDLACLVPIEPGSPLVGSAGAVALALSLLTGGAAFAFGVGSLRHRVAPARSSMRGPALAGIGVLVVSVGITLYAGRAIDERGREVRRSFAFVVDRALEHDLAQFVASRLAFFAERDDRIAGAPTPETEFFETARDATQGTYRDGQVALWRAEIGKPSGPPLVVPSGAPFTATRRAVLPESRNLLDRPEAYLSGAPENGDAQLVFEAPFRTRTHEGAIAWAIPLSDIFASVLAPERTGGFAVRVASEAAGRPSVFPPGSAPQRDEIAMEPFRFPPERGRSFHLVLGPRPSMDLFGAAKSKMIVLIFGLLLSFSAGVGTTLVLGSLAGYRRASRVDALTRLRNRLEFGEMLERERLRALRYERPLSVALLDLDEFKRVNDTLGHAAGDDALRAVARALESEVRATDFVFRHGGEEFAVLLPETDADAAKAVLERVRERFARGPLAGAERAGTITVSCGLATVSMEESSDLILSRADAALYEAKHLGRNRVVSATPPKAVRVAARS